MEVLGITTMNNTRSLFLVCLFLLSSLFAFNSYADEEIFGFEDGFHIWAHSDGRMYVVEFKDGLPNGQGTYTFPSGEKYAGEFKDGKFNGQGTWIHPDGRIYVGEWKDGKVHEQGTYTYTDGRKYVGEFKDTKTWKGTEFDNDGNVTAAYHSIEDLTTEK